MNKKNPAISVAVQVEGQSMPERENRRWTLTSFVGLSVLIAVTMYSATACWLAIDARSVEPLIRMWSLVLALLSAAAKVA